MAKAVDVAGIYKRVSQAKELTDMIYEQISKSDIKTIVLRFSRSYFVFVAGNHNLRAYPLSTTRYKYFTYASDIYNFLVSKNIKEVLIFDGDLDRNQIRERLGGKER